MSVDLRPAQAFLRDLADHNDRAWFQAQRDRYERDLKEPAEAFCEALRPALARLDPEVVVDARVNGSIMRLNRDLRFSKDKTPYRTDLGLRFWRGERKQGRSAFYLRVRPHAVGIAAGQWQFDPPTRDAWREAMASEAGAPVAATLEQLLADGAHVHVETLKRTPKPWDDDHPRALWLRHKGLVVGMEEALDPGPGLVDAVVDWWERMTPVHRFLAGLER